MSRTGCPVELRGACARLGGRQVLDGADLRVESGSAVVLTGANGAGKSTLLRAVLGQIALDAGSALLFGIEARRFARWERVGCVPQLPPASAGRLPVTALELVEASCDGAPRRGRLARRACALACLDEVGMSGCARRTLGALSGGQLQRVRLAAALACEPELLVLDEPTTGVDAVAAEALLALVENLCAERGAAVLLATHDARAAGISRAVPVVLRGGRVYPVRRAELGGEE